MVFNVTCDAGYVGYTRGHCQTQQEHARDNASGPAKAFQSAYKIQEQI